MAKKTQKRTHIVLLSFLATLLLMGMSMAFLLADYNTRRATNRDSEVLPGNLLAQIEQQQASLQAGRPTVYEIFVPTRYRAIWQWAEGETKVVSRLLNEILSRV